MARPGKWVSLVATPVAVADVCQIVAGWTQVGYVSEHNLFVEEVATGKTTQLTTDGTRKRINGTFDWAYEEEFGCRDGFRWSPDSKQIAYWQVDATNIRDYLMLNTTDSIYSHVVPVEYPKVGESPSPTRIGVVSVTGGPNAVPPTTWLNIPGDSQQHYLTRLEWLPASGSVIVQQLNRKQNESKLFICNPASSIRQSIFILKRIRPGLMGKHAGAATIQVAGSGWRMGKSFVWVSEKDGWRHLYRVGIDGKKETLLTPGTYDIATISHIDEATNQIYFIASPDNTNQRYLYRTRLDGKGKAERVTPAGQAGTHGYTISPNGRFAQHTFTNYQTPPSREWISLPDHKAVNESESIAAEHKPVAKSNVSFFKLTTDDGRNARWLDGQTDGF